MISDLLRVYRVYHNYSPYSADFASSSAPRPLTSSAPLPLLGNSPYQTAIRTSTPAPYTTANPTRGIITLTPLLALNTAAFPVAVAVAVTVIETETETEIFTVAVPSAPQETGPVLKGMPGLAVPVPEFALVPRLPPPA